MHRPLRLPVSQSTQSRHKFFKEKKHQSVFVNDSLASGSLFRRRKPSNDTSQERPQSKEQYSELVQSRIGYDEFQKLNFEACGEQPFDIAPKQFDTSRQTVKSESMRRNKAKMSNQYMNQVFQSTFAMNFERELEDKEIKIEGDVLPDYWILA